MIIPSIPVQLYSSSKTPSPVRACRRQGEQIEKQIQTQKTSLLLAQLSGSRSKLCLLLVRRGFNVCVCVCVCVSKNQKIKKLNSGIFKKLKKKSVEHGDPVGSQE